MYFNVLLHASCVQTLFVDLYIFYKYIACMCRILAPTKDEEVNECISATLLADRHRAMPANLHKLNLAVAQ